MQFFFSGMNYDINGRGVKYKDGDRKHGKRIDLGRRSVRGLMAPLKRWHCKWMPGSCSSQLIYCGSPLSPLRHGNNHCYLLWLPSFQRRCSLSCQRHNVYTAYLINVPLFTSPTYYNVNKYVGQDSTPFCRGCFCHSVVYQICFRS